MSNLGTPSSTTTTIRRARTACRLGAAVCLLGALLFASGCSAGKPRPVESRPLNAVRARHDATQLWFLHTGDWHGYAFADTRKDGTRRGGVVAARAFVRRMRADHRGRVTVLDAGDLLSGHPVVALTDQQGVKGGAFVRFWQRVGWDALELGNHEFDYGRKTLARLIELLEPSVLNANIRKSAAAKAQSASGSALEAPGGIPGTTPYVILDRAGVRVAVIGVITSELAGTVSREHLEGLRVVPAIEAIRSILPELEARSDVQILLSHAGIEEDRRIAEAVPELEAILGGHSHTRLKQAEVVNGVPICHAGPHGRAMGRLELVVSGKRVIRWSWACIDLVRDEATERAVEPELLEEERALSARVAKLEQEVIGRLDRKLPRSHHRDSPLGGAVAEALRRRAGANVAFINSGGIRVDLGPGPVSRADLMAAFPFGNAIVRFGVTGKELRAIVRHNIEAGVDRAHGILQAAGYHARYRVGEEGKVALLSLAVDGKPVRDDALYTIVTNAYVAESHPIKYLGLEPKRFETLSFLTRDAVAQAIAAGAFAAPPSPRHERVRAPARPRTPKPAGAGQGAPR